MEIVASTTLMRNTLLIRGLAMKTLQNLPNCINKNVLWSDIFDWSALSADQIGSKISQAGWWGFRLQSAPVDILTLLRYLAPQLFYLQLMYLIFLFTYSCLVSIRGQQIFAVLSDTLALSIILIMVYLYIQLAYFRFTSR